MWPAKRCICLSFSDHYVLLLQVMRGKAAKKNISHCQAQISDYLLKAFAVWKWKERLLLNSIATARFVLSCSWHLTKINDNEKVIRFRLVGMFIFFHMLLRMRRSLAHWLTFNLFIMQCLFKTKNKKSASKLHQPFLLNTSKHLYCL